MTDQRRPFHTFAAEFHDNKPSEDDEPILIACDYSLDEGAIIRTTAPHGSPLAGTVQYFVGMDSVEASAVLTALSTLYDLMHDDAEVAGSIGEILFGIEEVAMMRDRVARLPYFDGGTQS